MVIYFKFRKPSVVCKILLKINVDSYDTQKDNPYNFSMNYLEGHLIIKLLYDGNSPASWIIYMIDFNKQSDSA